MALQQNSGEYTVRVLVADNSRMHTQLLADALRRDRRLEVIGSASHSRDLIDAIITHKIDVAIISANLDEEPNRGLQVLSELRNSHPEVRTVVLLDSSKREAVVEAFRAGARGLFSRHESLETLAKCVRQVHEGQIWANSQQMLFAVEALASTPNVRVVGADGLSLLSKRELDVIHCLSEGLTNQEIAARLGLSQHTIKNYLFRLFDKLGVSNRVELLSLTMAHSSNRSGSLSRANGTLGAGNKSSSPEDEFALQHKAALEGSPVAQRALAGMYQDGKGVARNLAAAYQWYLTSEQTSAAVREETRSTRELLAESLTREQLMEAERKASAQSRTKKSDLPLRTS